MNENQFPLQTDVPFRKEGQRDVLHLAVAPLDVVRVGIVGLGKRGLAAVERWCNIERTEIVALCDVSPSCVDEAERMMSCYGKESPKKYCGEGAYLEMCRQENVHLVYICTDWMSHTPIALWAMQYGKHVAVEVPAATSLKDIWRLVDMAEQTQRHCMMLENAVYDFFEMAVLKMACNGMFGEIVHVEGGYMHRIGEKWSAWRLEHNRQNRGDVYPTHGLGPACRLLGIHRSDRLHHLVSMDTMAATGALLYNEVTGRKCDDFQNGDQTSTLIRTQKGRSILIQHNVMTPRPYSRMFQVVGTKGYAAKHPVNEICLDEETLRRLGVEKADGHGVLPAETTEKLLQTHQPGFVKDIEELGKRLDPRGGMSYMMDYRLAYCLQNGLPLDMDVYDMAEWCCVSELSRISIEHCSAPVAIPDFTRGEKG